MVTTADCFRLVRLFVWLLISLLSRDVVGCLSTLRRGQRSTDTATINCILKRTFPSIPSDISSSRGPPATSLPEIPYVNHRSFHEETTAHYRQLREEFYGRGAYNFSEDALNQLGYESLGREQIDAAIAMFSLNVEYFPESGNVYDSLAEAYMAAGRNDLAIDNYEKSLALAPDNENAAQKLDELRTKAR